MSGRNHQRRRPFANGDWQGRIAACTDRGQPTVAGMASPCWLWVGGSRIKGGYVCLSADGKTRIAHRWVYEKMVGPIPDGLTLDHLCRQPSCVNPEHLEPVPQRVNNLRASTTLTALNVAKTHCPQGHPYDEKNTYHMPKGGRDCKKCVLERSRRRNERRRAQRSGAAA